MLLYFIFLFYLFLYFWCDFLECGPLDQPCNGRVDLIGKAPGDVANYSCDTGFKLLGESSRACLDSLEWDGIAPCCLKKPCRRKLAIALSNLDLSRGMRFPAMRYVRPAKAQTSLRIRADCSEPLLVAKIFYEC